MRRAASDVGCPEPWPEASARSELPDPQFDQLGIQGPRPSNEESSAAVTVVGRGVGVRMVVGGMSAPRPGHKQETSYCSDPRHDTGDSPSLHRQLETEK